MTQRRVYTGTRPVVFMTGNVGPVGPGAEFSVPDEHLARFDQRPDITEPGRPKKPRKPRRAAPRRTPPPGTATVTSPAAASPA